MNVPSSTMEPVATPAMHRTRNPRSIPKPTSSIFKLKARNSARASGQILQTCASARSAFVSGVPWLLTRLKIFTTWSTVNSSPETLIDRISVVADGIQAAQAGEVFLDNFAAGLPSSWSIPSNIIVSPSLRNSWTPIQAGLFSIRDFWKKRNSSVCMLKYRSK